MRLTATSNMRSTAVWFIKCSQFSLAKKKIPKISPTVLPGPELWRKLYRRALRRAATLPDPIVREYIWDKTRLQFRAKYFGAITHKGDEYILARFENLRLNHERLADYWTDPDVMISLISEAYGLTGARRHDLLGVLFIEPCIEPIALDITKPSTRPPVYPPAVRALAKQQNIPLDPPAPVYNAEPLGKTFPIKRKATKLWIHLRKMTTNLALPLHNTFLELVHDFSKPENLHFEFRSKNNRPMRKMTALDRRKMSRVYKHLFMDTPELNLNALGYWTAAISRPKLPLASVLDNFIADSLPENAKEYTEAPLAKTPGQLAHRARKQAYLQAVVKSLHNGKNLTEAKQAGDQAVAEYTKVLDNSFKDPNTRFWGFKQISDEKYEEILQNRRFKAISRKLKADTSVGERYTLQQENLSSELNSLNTQAKINVTVYEDTLSRLLKGEKQGYKGLTWNAMIHEMRVKAAHGRAKTNAELDKLEKQAIKVHWKAAPKIFRRRTPLEIRSFKRLFEKDLHCSTNYVRLQKGSMPFKGEPIHSAKQVGYDISSSLQQQRHLKICFSESLNPYFNLALEDYIYQSRKPGTIQLIFYTNSPCIVVGRNQNIWREVNIDLAQKLGIPVLRRFSGGGTVYHDTGNANFCIMTDRSVFEREKLLRIVASALNMLNFDIRITERHSIVMNANDAKISGSAFKISKQGAYYHGTLLLHSNLSTISGLLTSPIASDIDSSHGVESVPSQVCNLNLTHDSFRAALSFKVIERFKAEFSPVFLSFSEHQHSYHERLDKEAWSKIKDTMDKLFSQEWTYAASPFFKYRIKLPVSNMGKHSESLIYLHIKDGVINDIEYDIASENETVLMIMALFKGKRFDLDAIRQLQELVSKNKTLASIV